MRAYTHVMDLKMMMLLCSVVAVFLFICPTAVTSSGSSTHDWRRRGDGSWSNAQFWEEGRLPCSDEDVVFPRPVGGIKDEEDASYRVSLQTGGGGIREIKSLYIEPRAGLLIQPGQGIRVSHSPETDSGAGSCSKTSGDVNTWAERDDGPWTYSPGWELNRVPCTHETAILPSFDDSGVGKYAVEIKTDDTQVHAVEIGRNTGLSIARGGRIHFKAPGDDFDGTSCTPSTEKASGTTTTTTKTTTREIKTTTRPARTTTSSKLCTSEEILCSVGGFPTCLSNKELCNGLAACDDAFDERRCRDPNVPGGPGSWCSEFECRSQAKCISRAALCDNIVDCAAGEDETKGCTNPEDLIAFGQPVDGGNNPAAGSDATAGGTPMGAIIGGAVAGVALIAVVVAVVVRRRRHSARTVMDNMANEDLSAKTAETALGAGAVSPSNGLSAWDANTYATGGASSHTQAVYEEAGAGKKVIEWNTETYAVGGAPSVGQSLYEEPGAAAGTGGNYDTVEDSSSSSRHIGGYYDSATVHESSGMYDVVEAEQDSGSGYIDVIEERRRQSDVSINLTYEAAPSLRASARPASGKASRDVDC